MKVGEIDYPDEDLRDAMAVIDALAVRDNYHYLKSLALRAYQKAKREYDLQQPDAGPDECWVELERLRDALELSP